MDERETDPIVAGFDFDEETVIDADELNAALEDRKLATMATAADVYVLSTYEFQMQPLEPEVQEIVDRARAEYERLPPEIKAIVDDLSERMERAFIFGDDSGIEA